MTKSENAKERKRLIKELMKLMKKGEFVYIEK